MTDDPPAPSPAPADGPRCGAVALIGRPNAGKSTLLNRLLAEKLAIVSEKPQTTRQRIVGILSSERGQIVFYDTPGVHKPQHRMNRDMVRAATEALGEADVVCVLVDASQPHGGGDRYLLEWVGRSAAPKIVVLNKIDLVRKASLLPRMALYAEAGLTEIIPLSALEGDGVDLLLEALWRLLPIAPPRFDPELLTVHPERFLVAERIREKVLAETEEELPYATAVVIDRWEERSEGLVAIYATILAERPGQKKILVGRGGARIRSIGTAARHDLEAFLERRVYLDLTVKVAPAWREDRRVLERLDREPLAVDATVLVAPGEPSLHPGLNASGDAPYTREELTQIVAGLPERGALCHACGQRIPSFADLTGHSLHRIRALIADERRVMAMRELVDATRCPLSWAKLWVLHGGRPGCSSEPPAPCPHCGEPLRTPRAKQCRHCKRDWHDPNNVKRLDVVEQGGTTNPFPLA